MNVQKKIEATFELNRMIEKVPEKYFRHTQGKKGGVKYGLKWNRIPTGIFQFSMRANI